MYIHVFRIAQTLEGPCSYRLFVVRSYTWT